MAKKRSEIEAKYQWDLSSLYPNDDAWHQDFDRTKALFEEIEQYQGKMLDSPENLLGLIECISKTDRVVSNLMTYSKMKQDENTKDSFYQNMNAKADALAGTYREVTAFFVPELMTGDVKVISAYLEDEKLSLYKQHIHNIMRAKPHTLSQESETILARASELMGAPQNAFGMLSSADLKFPVIKDDTGNDLELTHGNFVPTLMSKDRSVRAAAFKAYYSVYEGHKNAFASLLSSEVKKNVFYSKSKKHPSSRAAALFSNNVPESVYDQLVTAVHENLDALHEYIELRKQVLGVDELRPYDLYVPMIDDVDMKFPYEEACEHVLTSLKILGDDYTDVIADSFKDGWIDVYENEGKRSGAYSWGTYDSKPYILLNYHDTLNDMFTLTHELGHSMHSYYSRKQQPYIYGNYSIFVAEVASTTNEALLNKYLLNKVTDKREKLYLLNNYLENFRGTVFRQTMFAEFERDIHQRIEEGEALTAETLNGMYRSLNEKYYGTALKIDEELDLEWARIPHFYYDFYVYQYATGFSAAEYLADRIVNEPDLAVPAYKQFLSAGCSDYPIEVLKMAGVDMTTPDPVANALKVFRNLVNEMKELLRDA